MITTNSLAAFTQEIARTRPVQGPEVSAPDGVRAAGRANRPEVEAIAERRLEAVPPQPSKPVPRGSLLDLKV